MRGSWLCLALAACSSDGVLELRVVAPDGMNVDEVELFVGIHGKHENAIRPEGGQLANAVWWKRDHDRNNPQLDVRALEDGSVIYQFAPGGTKDEITALVAVGFGTDPDRPEKVPTGVATLLVDTVIPDNEIHRHTLHLTPFTAIGDVNASPGLPGLRLWGPPDDNKRACVQVDKVPDLERYPGATSGMIVTDGDPDCDGLRDHADPDLECDEYQYMAVGALKRDNLTCARRMEQTRHCVAGGETCSDGSDTTSGGCAPSSYCMPTRMCERCEATDPTATCDPYRPPVADIPHLECFMRIGLIDDNASEFCSGHVARANLPQLAGEAWVPIVCDGARAQLRKDAETAWSATHQLDTGGTLAVHALGSENCVFDFKLSGMPLVSTVPAGFPMSLAVPLTAPVAGRGLLLPIYFSFEYVAGDVCPTDPVVTQCTLNPSPATDELMADCIGAPIGNGVSTPTD